ncbi:MAG: type II toxin-antitoxin system RelE/ParE family toxin [Bacteroidetes bacterium]|nr:type II toxin-antitoxin system RelE/ParE family toxin [Bacteroidota bacterium]
MNYDLILTEEADQEWQEASLYYELRQKDLGERFSSEVANRLNYIQSFPEHFQKRKKEYRYATVLPFPFVIIFRIDKTKNAVVVVSVFHTKRKPKRKYS